MDDVHLINNVVAKIDVLLARVLTEVVIAEVTLGDKATSGISKLEFIVQNYKLFGGSGLLPGMGIAGVMVTSPDVVGAGPCDLVCLINLASTQRKSNASILSQPNIITTHNKQAIIFLGESRPVISSCLNDSTGTTTAGSGSRSTVGQREISIRLTAKPLTARQSHGPHFLTSAYRLHQHLRRQRRRLQAGRPVFPKAARSRAEVAGTRAGEEMTRDEQATEMFRTTQVKICPI